MYHVVKKDDVKNSRQKSKNREDIQESILNGAKGEYSGSRLKVTSQGTAPLGMLSLLDVKFNYFTHFESVLQG